MQKQTTRAAALRHPLARTFVVWEFFLEENVSHIVAYRHRRPYRQSPSSASPGSIASRTGSTEGRMRETVEWPRRGYVIPCEPCSCFRLISRGARRDSRRAFTTPTRIGRRNVTRRKARVGGRLTPRRTPRAPRVASRLVVGVFCFHLGLFLRSRPSRIESSGANALATSSPSRRRLL